MIASEVSRPSQSRSPASPRVWFPLALLAIALAARPAFAGSPQQTGIEITGADNSDAAPSRGGSGSSPIIGRYDERLGRRLQEDESAEPRSPKPPHVSNGVRARVMALEAEIPQHKVSEIGVTFGDGNPPPVDVLAPPRPDEGSIDAFLAEQPTAPAADQNGEVQP